MQIGLMTDSVPALSITETLDLAAELGLDTVEFATGNWSTAPHLDLGRLLADETARTALAAAVAARSLRISALNANGNPLHPATGREQDRVLRDTIRLASLLGVDTVVCMSGLPAAPGDHTPNWITTCWPPETTGILRAQWDIAIRTGATWALSPASRTCSLRWKCTPTSSSTTPRRSCGCARRPGRWSAPTSIPAT